jgi:hypothetical protein
VLFRGCNSLVLGTREVRLASNGSSYRGGSNGVYFGNFWMKSESLCVDLGELRLVYLCHFEPYH